MPQDTGGLDSNRSYYKTHMWFRFNSHETYRMDAFSLEFNLVDLEHQQFLSNDFRVVELPDSSFIVTGGQRNGMFAMVAMHLKDN